MTFFNIARLFLLILLASLEFLLVQSQTEVRGPPQTTEKLVVIVGKVGENLRLQCPIIGFPSPFFEWKKDGHPIDDITWIRYRKNKNVLKIRNANRDDTGIYTCKGINGFGSDEARIELVIVDAGKQPSQTSPDEETSELAPPVFTEETKQAEKQFRKDVGDNFKISCEALGSPRPTLRWFKDGHEIRDSVSHSRRQSGSPFGAPGDATGRSTVELQVLGTVDAGVYTCRAQNDAGSKDQNFTLSVNVNAVQQQAVVTEAGPANSSVFEGETATLKCRVKSVALPPHIKWLKKLETSSADSSEGNLDQRVVSVHTMSMGSERYRVLDTDPDVMVADGEFVNNLVIASASLADAGMYICFVTNSGFGALTYRSAFLRVMPRVDDNIAVSSAASESVLLYAIVSLIVVAFLAALFAVICVIKRSRRSMKSASSPAGSSSDGSRPEDALQQQQRPFLMDAKSAHLPLPPPPLPLFPSSSSSTIGQWSRTVYPVYSGGRILKPYGGSSCHNNSAHYESPVATAGAKFCNRVESPNQYEVPYSHLQRMMPPSVLGGKSSSGNSNNSLNPLLHHMKHQQQQQGMAAGFRYPPQGVMASNGPYQKEQQQPAEASSYPRNYQYFQYLNDYEA